MSRANLLKSFVIFASLGAFAAPADAQFFFFEQQPAPVPAPRALPKPKPKPRPVLRDDDDADDPGVVDLHGGSVYRDYGLEAPRGARGTGYAALPADADPAYSTPVDLDNKVNYKQTTQKTVVDPTGETAGTVTINTRQRKLYYSLGDGQAVSYSIAVGKTGFSWKGQATIGRKAFWPGWTPPKEMLERRPDLPEHMDGALNNPLGARALYLFQGKTDTLFRIHGTNEPKSIGTASSSGCIRMHNADVIDLYGRVSAGTKVVVM